MSDQGGWASPSGWSSPGGEPRPAAPDVPAAPEFSAPPGWGGAPEQPQPAWGAPRPPEVKPGVVPLRPLGLGELLDGAVGVIRRYPRPTLGLSAAIAAVSTLLNVVLAVTAFRPFLDLDQTAIDEGGADLDAAIGGAAAAGIAGALLSALAGIVLTGVITAVVGRAVLGQPLTFAEAWAQVRPKLWRLLGLALLTGLVVGGVVLLLGGVAFGIALAADAGVGLAVLVVVVAVGVAVWLYVRLSLASSALVLEGATIRGSLRRSWLLVRRSWWRIAGILLLTTIIAAVVSQVVQIPFALVGLGPDALTGATTETSTGQLIGSYVGAGVAQALVAPFTAAVSALLYVDRRMRAEGLDIALAAAARPE